MNYREVVFTVQVKSRCWKCPLTSTLVTHSSPSRCQIVCVRARPPQKRAFHRISRHLSWAALHLPICIDQTAFISPLHGGKKITIKKAKKEYQKKGRTSCKWEFTSEQRRLRLSAGDIMSCVTRQEDCCSRYLAACISSLCLIVSEEPADLWMQLRAPLWHNTYSHEPPRSSSRLLLARLALFMKPSITHI